MKPVLRKLFEGTAQRSLVMGVINVSPNSYFNPSHSTHDAVVLAEQMVRDGVDIIDIGGEATNPYLDPAVDAAPSTQEEIDRVMPALKAIRAQHPDIALSIDTSTPELMHESLHSGADMINDQRALRREGALDILVESGAPVCLMHLFPMDRQFDDIDLPACYEAVKSELLSCVSDYESKGLKPSQIILDPGFGQGAYYRKNCDENFYLLHQLRDLAQEAYPLLVGWSRKSMIGDVLGQEEGRRLPPACRLNGSLAAAVIAVLNGAKIIRTHDVKETLEALKIANYYQATNTLKLGGAGLPHEAYAK